MRKFQYLLVFFVVLLVMSLPVVTAQQLKSMEVHATEVKTPLFATASEEAQVALSEYQQMMAQYSLENNPSEQCQDRSEEATSHWSGVVENDILVTIEAVLDIMHLICLTMNTIDNVLVTVGGIIGLVGPDGSGCCAVGIFGLGIPCISAWEIYDTWQNFYSPIIKPLCCYFTCGWCTTGCWGMGQIFDGEKGPPDPTQDKSGFSLYGAKNTETDNWLEDGGIDAIGLSPYDNIYTAIACLCPGAVLTNLRKLNAIYKTYDCCIQEACKTGLSTEGCEAMLDESTCIFWEGAFISSLAKIVTKMIVHLVMKMEFLSGTMIFWINCIMIIYEAINLPNEIMAVFDAWSNVGDKFDSPDCKDLGFDSVFDDFSTINEQLLDVTPVQYQDYDGDGYVDGSSGAPSGLTEEDIAALQQYQREQGAAS